MSGSIVMRELRQLNYTMVSLKVAHCRVNQSMLPHWTIMIKIYVYHHPRGERRSNQYTLLGIQGFILLKNILRKY